MSENAWIETFTGKRFHLLAPQPDEIDIVDIAHGLSNLCRFTGHTRDFYSVAQHSFLVSHQVPAELALTALLHDATEAYISDLSRPLKHFTPVGAAYQEIEERIAKTIAEKFGTVHPLPSEVQHADHQLLYAEKEQLMSSANANGWAKTTGEESEPQRLDILIFPWDNEWAEKIFLERFQKLTHVSTPTSR